ncbi:MAG: class I SAM-dependent methyltransferase [Promethearchaeota archaeon]
MTKDEKNKLIAMDAYNSMAREYSERVLTKDYNAYLERPAILSLLPDVDGLYVLDAGCGPGHNAEYLIKHGAKVVAVDVSPKMLEITQERLGNTADIREVDLNQPLPFFKEEMFDLIFSSLVMGYILDWHATLKEFYRILRPGGELIFSTIHPCNPSTMRERKDYFETRRVEWLWTGFGKPTIMPFYHRSLSAFFEPLLEAGFRILKVLETRPLEEFRKVNPEDYDRVLTRPSFLCIKAGKPSN